MTLSSKYKDPLIIVIPGLFLSSAALLLLHIMLKMEFSAWVLVRISSDALILIAAALPLYLLPWFRRTYTFIILLIWALFQQGSFEYELNKFRPLRFEDLRFLESPEFLLGSGFRFSSMVFVAIFLLGAIFIARKASRRREVRLRLGQALQVLGLGLLCLILLVLLQLPAGRPWQARHPVSAFTYSAVRMLKNQVERSRAEYADNLNPESFGRRLNPVIEKGEVKGEVLSGNSISVDPGERIAGPVPGRNVLLIVLEGVSSAYLPAVARSADFTPSLVMTNLNRIAGESFYSPNFVIHMHQTIRGLYSLLTGDYPKLDLSSPKAFEVVAMGSGEVESLPRTLNKHGYHTVYLQAAGLPFMAKDRFMKAAGFHEVHGNEWFAGKETRVSSGWGVDDLSFFEGSQEMIERLKVSDQPWFLTMLTVGTHHPYDLVPESFDPPGVDDWARAVIFLDHAVGRFFSYLEESGILEDTLVIITSDEFRGYPDKPLKCNWGLNLILLPEMPEQKMNSSLFGQIDLPYSVLDYLGIEDQAESGGRRSFFREYDRAGRELFFTRDGWGKLWFRPGNLLLRMDNDEVFAYQLEPERFFNRDSLVELDIEEDLRGQLYREMEQNITYLDSSVYTSTDTGPWMVSLADAGGYHVSGGRRVVLADGQYFSLPPSRITLEIQIENDIDSRGKIKIDECFFYMGRDFRKQLMPSYPWLDPGMKMEFSFSCDFPEGPRQLCLRLELRSEGGDAEISVGKALLTAFPFPSGQKAREGRVNRLVVR